MMLRRIKDQVNLSLPSRREITVLVPLTQQQIFWYKNLLHGLDQDTIETVMKETENNMNVNDHSDGNKEASAVYDNQLTGNPTDTNDPDLIMVLILIRNLSSTDDVLTKSNSGGAADSDWRKLMNLIIQLRKVRDARSYQHATKVYFINYRSVIIFT
jgi:SNF2 family DNA or RNA helicase